MRIRYIMHNCFGLEFGGECFLFDYPGDGHLTEAAKNAAFGFVRGRDVVFFFSHSHGDHFNVNVRELGGAARSARYVVSDDVEEMYPGVLDGEGVLVVEPDEEYGFGGLGVETLMSNDLGVAFVIRCGAGVVYYGGDLAHWDWPNLPDKARAMASEFFEEALARVARHSVDVAFADVDMRLANLAGGLRVAEMLRPRVFVPMHLFGNTAGLGDLAGRVEAGVEVFVYREPGDEFETVMQGEE